MLQSLFYLTIFLYVSSIIITHLREHKTTVTTKFTHIKLENCCIWFVIYLKC